MLKRNNLMFLVVIIVSFLIYGCGEPPIEIGYKDTFSNYDNQFKVVSAERYSQSHQDGDYIVYDEVVFILLEWKCVRESSKDCIAGGADFVLYDKTRDRQFENITYKEPVINQFKISIPHDAYNCCSAIDGGDTYQVYVLFKVGCYRDLVLKYPSSTEYSETGMTYYVELPERAQCQR